MPLKTAATVFSGVLSALAGKYGVDKEVAEQRYLQEHANELDIAKWNMLKDYESPQAQMQRFKDAGLNPDLIYGQQSSAPSMPESSVPNAPNIAGAYNAAAGNINESMLIASQIHKNEADAEQASAGAYKDTQSVDMLFPALVKQYMSIAGLNVQKVKESESIVNSIQQKIAESEALIRLYDSNITLNKSALDLNNVKLKYADEYYDKSIDEIVSRTNMYDAQKESFKETAKRMRSTLKLYQGLLRSQSEFYNQSAELDKSQSELNKQRKEWYDKKWYLPRYDLDGNRVEGFDSMTLGDILAMQERKTYQLLNMELKLAPIKLGSQLLSGYQGLQADKYNTKVDVSNANASGKISKVLGIGDAADEYLKSIDDMEDVFLHYLKLSQ